MNDSTVQRGAPVGSLDTALVSRLRAVSGKLRSYVLVSGVAYVVAFLLTGALIQLAIDYGTSGLRWSIRAAMLGAIVVGAIALIRRRIISPLRRRFGSAEVANLVERHYPELSSSLISAVRFTAGEVGDAASNSPSLMASVVGRAGRMAGEVDFDVVLNPRRPRQAGLILGIAILVCASAAVAAPDLVGLWFARNVLLRDVDWPKRTHLILDLDGNELIGALGDDVVIEATAQGVQPRVVEFMYETVSGQHGRESMVTVGSESAYHYRYTFQNAREDFDFYLVGGDDQTKMFHTRLLERPHVARTEMRIVAPAYAQLAAVELKDGQRAAQILPGSEVTIRVETNKPVTQATLMAGRTEVAVARRQSNRIQVTVSPTETHTYHFALRDEVGLENRRPLRFSLRVVPDEPPRVRLKLSGAGEMITSEAVLPMELEFADKYGLATAELAYTVSRESTTVGSIPLPAFQPGTTTFATSVTWPVATEGLVPGDAISLFSQASDFDDVNGPNAAQSPEILLRVVSREELLAELSRREQEYRGDFERLVDAQEQVRGDLLTVLRLSQDPSHGDALAADLAPLERRQRNISGSVNVVRQQFEQILAILRVNQLDTLDERERLGDRIIGPLTQLAKRELVAAADAVRHWSREASAEKAAKVDPQQIAILAQMRSVLNSMVQWEGYQEVVNMLRDIIRLQHDLHAETKSALEEQAGEVFED